MGLRNHLFLFDRVAYDTRVRPPLEAFVLRSDANGLLQLIDAVAGSITTDGVDEGAFGPVADLVDTYREYARRVSSSLLTENAEPARRSVLESFRDMLVGPLCIPDFLRNGLGESLADPPMYALCEGSEWIAEMLEADTLGFELEFPIGLGTRLLDPATVDRLGRELARIEPKIRDVESRGLLRRFEALIGETHRAQGLTLAIVLL
jgi:hypothetical protein